MKENSQNHTSLLQLLYCCRFEPKRLFWAAFQFSGTRNKWMYHKQAEWLAIVIITLWNHCPCTRTRLYLVQALLFIFEVSMNWTEVTVRTKENIREKERTLAQAALFWRWENCNHVMLPSNICTFKEDHMSYQIFTSAVKDACIY